MVKKLKHIPGCGKSRTDTLVARLEQLASMSKEERLKMVREVTHTKAPRLTDDEYTVMMAQDGYFQNEDGEYD